MYGNKTKALKSVQSDLMIPAEILSNLVLYHFHKHNQHLSSYDDANSLYKCKKLRLYFISELCTSAAVTSACKALAFEDSGENGKNEQHVDNPFIL